MALRNTAKEYLLPNVVTMISLTYCPYCDKAKSLWKSIGVQFEYYEVDQLNFPDEIIDEFHQLSKIKTYPKNFVGDYCIGGFDSLSAALKTGQLFKILDEHKIQYTKE